jgi:hypothetical protein
MSTTSLANVPTSVRPPDVSIWPLTTDIDGILEPSVSLEIDADMVRLVRELRCNGVPVLRTEAWSAKYAGPSFATDAYEALSLQRDRFTYWSVGASAMGPEWLTPIVEDHVSEYVQEREQSLAKANREAEEARKLEEQKLAAAAKITAYYRILKKCFAVTLEYGNDEKAFWSIKFDEAWERDRFWDWFNWQSDRYPEFAEYLKDGDRLELERKLLKEMLVTEQKVKKQGLGAGGRRPLRFWRGEV